MKQAISALQKKINPWASKGFSLAIIFITGLHILTVQTLYSDCTAFTPADFRVTPIVTKASGDLHEPVKLAFHQDENDSVFVYFIELRQAPKVASSMGKVKVFNPYDESISEVGSLPVSGLTNEGLSGIALHPDFSNNGWMYLFYSHGSSEYRLSRFTVLNGKFTTATEKILLIIPITADKFHTGGAMEFDSYGDLWLSVGDNHIGIEAAGSGPSNTNDLRGKILRLSLIDFPDSDTPEVGLGFTYNVPEGNLFEAGMAATKPEIYTMGLRNAYTLNLDPVRRWVVTGDVGPDVDGTTEEFLLLTQPSNEGWPFWAGNNVEVTNGAGTAESPYNLTTGNTGLNELPPAQPATWAYKQSAAITGPIYRFNPDNPNPNKLPVKFNNFWFVADYKTNWIKGFQLNDDGTLNGGLTDISTSIITVSTHSILDFKAGPDGALYILNYDGSYENGPNTGIVKIDYIGEQCTLPDNFIFNIAGCMLEGDPNKNAKATHSNPIACANPDAATTESNPKLALSVSEKMNVTLKGSLLNIQLDGHSSVDVVTMDGKTVSQYTLDNQGEVMWSQGISQGMYLVVVKNHGYVKVLRGVVF